MARKKKNPEQEIKDWYYSVWLFEGARKIMRRDGAVVVKGMREIAGMNQRKFAEALGIDFTYLSKIENNRTPLTISMVKRLRKFLEERDGK